MLLHEQHRRDRNATAAFRFVYRAGAHCRFASVFRTLDGSKRKLTILVVPDGDVRRAKLGEFASSKQRGETQHDICLDLLAIRCALRRRC